MGRLVLLRLKHCGAWIYKRLCYAQYRLFLDKAVQEFLPFCLGLDAILFCDSDETTFSINFRNNARLTTDSQIKFFLDMLWMEFILFLI